MTINIKEMMGPPPLKSTNVSSEPDKKTEILALVDIENELPFSATTQTDKPFLNCKFKFTDGDILCMAQK